MKLVFSIPSVEAALSIASHHEGGCLRISPLPEAREA
jgi:hypothetical protein